VLSARRAGEENNMTAFIEAKNRKDLRNKVDEGKYAVIKKVCGGYMCFATVSDYEIWRSQK
jgi:hypothetical protein